MYLSKELSLFMKIADFDFASSSNYKLQLKKLFFTFKLIT